jgi:hypothetical protein
MPRYKKGSDDSHDDLEIASRVLETVNRQVASYMISLDKVRLMRKEIEADQRLTKRIRSGPAEMTKVLVERGIPQHLAAGMAAEDFQDQSFGGELGFWTWDCCCTGCCLTCICTQNTVA